MSHGTQKDSMATTSPQPSAQRHAVPLALVRGSAKAYRLLEAGEKIQKGDQFLSDDCETWISLPIDGGDAVWQCWMIGAAWNPGMMVPHRRPLLPNVADDLRPPLPGVQISKKAKGGR